MAESFKSMATCGCGAVGDVVDQSDRFEFKDPWFVVQHQGDVRHRNVRVKDEGKFRLKMEG